MPAPVSGAAPLCIAALRPSTGRPSTGSGRPLRMRRGSCTASEPRRNAMHLILSAPLSLSKGRSRRTHDANAAFLQPEVEFADQLVVVELVGGAAFEGDLAVDDDVAAIGDLDRLGEVLLGHEHAQMVAVLELLDLLDGAAHEQRR